MMAMAATTASATIPAIRPPLSSSDDVVRRPGGCEQHGREHDGVTTCHNGVRVSVSGARSSLDGNARATGRAGVAQVCARGAVGGEAGGALSRCAPLVLRRQSSTPTKSRRSCSDRARLSIHPCRLWGLRKIVRERTRKFTQGKILFGIEHYTQPSRTTEWTITAMPQGMPAWLGQHHRTCHVRYLLTHAARAALTSQRTRSRLPRRRSRRSRQSSSRPNS